jgi:pimeloyl-ACP methyl ester carboxylesterase
VAEVKHKEGRHVGLDFYDLLIEATRYLTRKRGAISDQASPSAGDVLLYEVHGDRIRRFIADAIANAPGPVTLLTHSLGGIACVDLLASTPQEKVTGLITVGSQSPFLYEIDCLPCVPWGQKLPPGFPKWLNIYDERDLLSYIGEGVFPGQIEDFKVDNGQPFPESP